MTSATDLSVIVVNWNAGDALDTCLSAVFSAVAGMRAEVWLVDNASEDGSTERAARDHRALRVIRNAANVGFARGVNEALPRAGGEVTLLLNPDAVIERDALLRLMEVMRADTRIGIAGCGSVSANGRPAPGYETSYPGLRAEMVRPGSAAASVGDVAWVSGACLLARRHLVNEVGLLDPSFFMYYEDVDWCYRARQAGWRVVTVRDASVRHDPGGPSSRVPIGITARRAAASRVRFFGKHYSPARALWLQTGMVASALFGFLAQAVPALVNTRARRRLAVNRGRLLASLLPNLRQECSPR